MQGRKHETLREYSLVSLAAESITPASDMLLLHVLLPLLLLRRWLLLQTMASQLEGTLEPGDD